MLASIGTHGLLWIYAAISSLGCIFIAIGLPETKGKLPFEIAGFYQKRFTLKKKIKTNIAWKNINSDTILKVQFLSKKWFWQIFDHSP